MLLQIFVNIFNFANCDIISVSSSLESKVTPQGSFYGGQQLYIKGSGFDITTFDNQIKIGNIDCPIVNYFTSEYLLSCIVPFEHFIHQGIINSTSADNYQISVTTKGNQHSCNNCYIYFYQSLSPFIRGIARNHIVDGDQLKIVGFFRLSSEDQIEDILLGDGYRCQHEENSLSKWSYDTSIGCKFSNLPPGEYQMHTKINNETGRAIVMDSAKAVNLTTGKQYDVKVFPKITSFNTQNIFQTGGVMVIKGKGFGKDKSKITAELQFQLSDLYTYQILEVIDTEIKIEFNKNTGTINEENKDKVFLGGPGLEHRYIQQNISISSYTGSGTYPSHADEVITLKLSLEHQQYQVRYIQRYSGIFQSRDAGKYKFWVSADDDVKITLKKVEFKQDFSEDTPDFTCQFTSHTSYRDYFQFQVADSFNACEFTLEANTSYYIIAIQRDGGGANHFSVGLSIPQTQTVARKDDHPAIIEVKITNNPIDEVFSITQVNATGGTFNIFFQSRDDNGDFTYDKRIENLAYNISANDLKNKIYAQTYWHMNITREFLNASQTVVADEADAKGYKWTVTFTYFRSQTMLPFLVKDNLIGSNIILSKTQVTLPSPRISGSFKLKINDQTSVAFNHSAGWTTIVNEIRQFNQFFKTGVQVMQNGNDHTGRRWILFLSGQKSVTASIEESTITGGDPSNLASITLINHVQNSNDLFHYQIPHELFRTFSDKQQLNIKIGDTYAACVNRTCDVTTIPLASVPQIDSYTINSNTITFVLNNTYTTLTQYDYTNTNFEIEFAGYQCVNINSSSLPNVTCAIQLTGVDQLVSAGTWKPKVSLKNYGYLEHSLSDTVFELIVDSITPLEGSPGGNTLITINGKRFDKNAVVQINSKNCVIQTQTFNQITCLTPPNPEASYDVIITQNGQTKTFTTQFEYKASLVATINSISPTNASPVLKNTLTINGSGFDVTNTKVTLQNTTESDTKYQCFIMTISTTVITCRLGGGKTGDYNVIITTPQGIVQASTQFAYRSTITNIDITEGSTLGGNVITITGTNFSTTNNENLVAIGDELETYYCNITSATTTEIKCMTTALKSVTKYTNQTTDLKVRLKLAEYAECLTTCTFKFNTALDVSITSINKSEFVKNEQIQLVVDKTLAMSDDVKLLMVQGENKEEVSMTSVSGTTLNFLMPDLKHGSYSLGLLSKKGTGKFTISNVITNKLQIDSIDKTEGYFGGNEILINGNGFDDTLRFYVKSNSYQCRHQQVINPSQVKCVIREMTIDQQNLTVFLKKEDNTQIDCASCQYAVKAENYIEDTMTPNSSNTKNFTFALTFNGSPTLSDVTSVSLYNSSTKVESPGTFTITDQTLNLTFNNMNYGSYYVWVKTANGFFRVNTQFQVVNDPATNTINNVISSFMGGMEGSFNIGKVTNDLKVFVCGLEAKVTDYTEGNTKYETPILSTSQIIDEYDLKQGEKILPKTVLKTNVSSEQNLYDDDLSTGISYSTNCEFIYDFGEGYQVMLSLIKIFPKLNDSLSMIGATIQGSNDNTNYNTLHTYNEEFHEKWTEKTFDFSQKYRYIKFKSTKCQVAEFEVHGKKILDNTITLTSHKCPIKITMGSINIEKVDVVEYRQDKTPKITSISPEFLESSGGNVTVLGSNLSTDCKMKLDSAESSAVTGTTSFIFDMPTRPILLPREQLNIKCQNGNAALMGKEVLYVDNWSNTNTWGQDFKPLEGDTVYVPKGQTLLVDESPPKLNLITVEGKLIFKDMDINLDLHYLIVRGGELRAGTSTATFQNKLVITLHGLKSDNALPGMGNKLIGVINGKLQFYGAPRTPTWSKLQTTASVGNTTITLIDEVNWKVGDKLIIAMTGLNREEFEERHITAIASDKKTLTLDKALEYNHYGGELTYGNKTVELRAEVANFTRQIVVQGDPTSVETQHGSHVMFRGTSDKVRGEISQIETRNCGQLFNMGRYPLHFHMIGNVNGSFIDGVSVYNSFNRGTTVHGVHYLQIKNSVYFKHEGHGIFIEDSVESQNTITGNLVMHTNVATALLESDLKAAGMWITRPNNFINNNTAVGAEKFGFWFDLPDEPTGPSSNVANVCPVGEKLGSFENNYSHGNGIGLRIYPQYIPRTYQCKPQFNFDKFNIMEDNPSNRQFFRNCILWNNGQGLFNRKGGTFTIEGFSILSNHNNLSFSEPQNQLVSEMTTLQNSILVGKTPAGDLHSLSTAKAIGLGRKEGLVFKNIKIYNQPSGTFLGACTACDPLNEMHQTKGVHVAHFSGISFFDTTFTQLVSFNEPEYGMDLIHDDDGSIFGMGSGTILPYLKHLDNSTCTVIEDTTKCSVKCLFCPSSVQIRRLELPISNSNEIKGLQLKVFNMDQSGFTNNLTDNSLFSVINHRNVQSWRGWTIPVILGKTYNLHFSTGTTFNDLSIENNYYWTGSDKVTLRFNITDSPELYDVFYTGFESEQKVTKKLLEQDVNLNQGTNYAVYNYFKTDNANKYLQFGISEQNIGKIDIKKINCRFQCPEVPGQEPDEDFSRYWSKPENWNDNKIPEENNEIEIESGWVMIFDVQTTPKLKLLTINGTLQFNDIHDLHVLKTERIIINSTGKLLIGNSTTPFTKKAQIILFGNQQSIKTQIASTIDDTNKSIVNAGVIDINAKTSHTNFVKLGKNALVGETSITISKQVDWQIGDEIAISSTSQKYDQYEKVKITAINQTVITFTPALVNNHYGQTEINTVNGVLDMRAEVILLTRNVEIIGDDDGNWGCTVQTIGYRTIDTNIQVNGTLKMIGVSIRGCGQLNSEHGALAFIDSNNEQKQQLIEHCSISDGLGIGISAKKSQQLKIRNTNIYSVVKTGVSMNEVKNGEFVNNIVMGIRKRSDYANETILDLLNGFQYDSATFLEPNNFLIKDNIISSAPWFAWLVPGYSCTFDDVNNTINFRNNVGHSSMAGWFGNRVSSQCQKYSSFTGYRNVQQGFVNRFMIFKLYVDKFILSDNGNALALNGGAGTEKDYPFSEVKNSVIIGQTMIGCSFCYDNDVDCNTNGIITSLFEIENFNLEFNDYKLPLHNVTFTNFEWGGRQYIDNVKFKNFQNDKPACEKSNIYAIQTNRFTQDTSVYFKILSSTVENVDEKNKFFFFNHTRVTHPTFCNKRDCTGIYNILIEDLSKQFDKDEVNYEKQAKQYFGYNKGLNDGNCTFIKEWNGHRCNQVYQLLSIKKIDRDRGPVITPIQTSVYQFGYEGTEFNHFLSVTDNHDQIPNIVKMNSYQKIQFSQSMKNGNYYKLDNYNDNQWAVFRIQQEDPAIMTTVVNGSKQVPLVVKDDEQIDWSQYASKCGTHTYFNKNQTLIWVMNGQSNCEVHVKILSAIKIEMALSIDPSDFYKDVGETTFIDRIAKTLNIHPSRIKIVGVRKGSTIVNFYITEEKEGDGSGNTSTNEEDQIKELNTVTKKLRESVNQISEDLGVEVKSVDSNLAASQPDTFEKKCRFYSYTSWLLISTYEQLALYTDDGRAFKDVSCINCVVNDDCEAILPLACNQFKDFMGTSCDTKEVPTDEKNTPNDGGSKNIGILNTFLIILLALFL